VYQFLIFGNEIFKNMRLINGFFRNDRTHGGVKGLKNSMYIGSNPLKLSFGHPGREKLSVTIRSRVASGHS